MIWLTKKLIQLSGYISVTSYGFRIIVFWDPVIHSIAHAFEWET